ncbi:Zinc finger MYND domain-containing protein 10 [Fasciola gigantica]|uniref:Zinc finger MYND domain-containing protein 10 n=1 Tax=Fasciola gigantica TaxID=46835 RepID=A0A504YJT5_FASGI|nr:Zinc finger MYND domain-containing protein 10 [Fasciola gigantica]
MIQSLKLVEYEEYGLEKWFNYHSYISKLNMQAVNSAQTNSDEFVKEYFIANDKLTLTVHDLIALELWQQKVFHHLKERQEEPSSTFPVYTILYHELIVANLLETLTFHMDAMEALNDSAVDLVDWCYRSLCYLVTNFSTEDDKTDYLRKKDEIEADSNLKDLQRQQRVISFDKAMKAISILRHLIDHSLSANSVLPLGVGRRLLETNDVTLLLCQLIEQPPWYGVAKNKETGKPCQMVWHESGIWIPAEQMTSSMGKAEGQIWLSLFQILLANQSSLRYDCSATHRRAALLRLRSHLTEDKLDAIPVLADLRRFLEHLSMSPNVACNNGGSGVAGACLIELLPEIRDSLCRKYAKKWKQLAIDFFDRIESDRGKQAARRAAAQWTETFSVDHLDKLFSNFGEGELGQVNPYGGPARCAVCGGPAVKRCSRCRSEWYCRRECQVKHWPKHKKACDLMSDAIGTEQNVHT